MKKLIMLLVSIPAVAIASKYEIVSNDVSMDVSGKSATPMLATAKSPADLAFEQSGAVLIGEVHWSNARYDKGVSTNSYLGSWEGDCSSMIFVKQIDVDDESVVLTVEERFLTYTNKECFARQFLYEYSHYNTFYVLNTDAQIVSVAQECEPPPPWTGHGAYAPYCRDGMTNRIEHIERHEKVNREVIGYYDADGDGYATASRVRVVQSAGGNYLEEYTEGDIYVVNDVIVAKYTIPRDSYLNFIDAQEDSQRHYWHGIRGIYRIKLETTDLLPWWKMPEYQ